MFSYWFYPNPGNASYDNPKVVVLIIASLLLFAGSFVLAWFRRRSANAMTKRLMRSWPASARWFGGIAFVLTVARAEEIQFLSIRALWLVWVVALILTVIIQLFQFRRKHYTIVQKEPTNDPRAKYLPHTKK